MSAKVDFEALSDTQRLALVECMLGLLPSNQTWEDRAVFAAFLIAGERGGDAIEGALKGLERLKPGYFEECVRFVKDMKGEDLLNPTPPSERPDPFALADQLERAGAGRPCRQ